MGPKVAGPLGFCPKFENLFAQSRLEDSRSTATLLNIILAGCWSLNILPVILKQHRCVKPAKLEAPFPLGPPPPLPFASNLVICNQPCLARQAGSTESWLRRTSSLDLPRVAVLACLYASLMVFHCRTAWRISIASRMCAAYCCKLLCGPLLSRACRYTPLALAELMLPHYASRTAWHIGVCMSPQILCSQHVGSNCCFCGITHPAPGIPLLPRSLKLLLVWGFTSCAWNQFCSKRHLTSCK